MKVCKKCGAERSEDAFELYKKGKYRRTECRECRAQSNKDWTEKRRLNPPKSKVEEKRCKGCQEVKLISEFSPGNPGYFHPYCRPCERAIKQEKRREQYRNDPTGRFYWPFVNDEGVMVKRCTSCHAEKALSEFYANGKRGRHGKCKDCDKTIKQADYDANPEKYRSASLESARKYPDRARARHQRWYSANREYCAQRDRKRRTAQREKYLAYDRVRHSKETPEFRHMWYMRRHDKILAYAKEYTKHNAEKIRAWRKTYLVRHAENQNRRRARKMNAPRIEKIDRKAIIERDKWTCYLCLQICTPQNVTLDHVIPLFHGGSHTADNLRVACRPCNCSKGHKLYDFLA